MSLRIQNNVEAMGAHRALMANNDKLSKSMERLSSGYRINRAADDAAGLAISERMRAQINGGELGPGDRVRRLRLRHDGQSRRAVAQKGSKHGRHSNTGALKEAFGRPRKPQPAPAPQTFDAPPAR